MGTRGLRLQPLPRLSWEGVHQGQQMLGLRAKSSPAHRVQLTELRLGFVYLDHTLPQLSGSPPPIYQECRGLWYKLGIGYWGIQPSFPKWEILLFLVHWTKNISHICGQGKGPYSLGLCYIERHRWTNAAVYLWKTQQLDNSYKKYFSGGFQFGASVSSLLGVRLIQDNMYTLVTSFD